MSLEDAYFIAVIIAALAAASIASTLFPPLAPAWSYTQSCTLVLPGVLLKCHLGQYSQSSTLVAPSPVPYLLLGHGAHWSRPSRSLKVPRGHGSHTPLPWSAAKLPGAHIAQSSG